MGYRTLALADVELLRQIDRSELVEEAYSLREGHLSLRPERWDVKGFPPGELEALVGRQRRLCAAAGVLLGAFEDGRIAVTASVEWKLRGPARDRVKMDILFVSAPFRGRGVARELVERSTEVARGMGASFLYVPATPSRHTVDFYLRRGARLAAVVDPELFATEPEDIHLEIPIERAR
jgi:GNAT superfamily N-acetyltransferase